MWKVRKVDSTTTYSARDLKTLQAWCRSGRIRETDQVKPEGEQRWRRADTLFELAGHFVRSGSPPVLAGGAAAEADMLASTRPTDQEDIQLDLTSVMDMSFLLLIFLTLVATPAFQRGLAVDLPASRTAGPVTKTNLVVSLDAQGRIYLDQTQVSTEELSRQLREAAQRPDFGTLVLRADGEVRHAAVVAVLDVISSAGIEKVSIATRPLMEKNR